MVTCNKCRYNFGNAWLLLIHTCIAEFICISCFKSYSRKSDLTRHSNSCGREFICPQCNKILSTDLGLGHHLLRKHGIPNSTICSHCGKDFKNRKNLKYHEKVLKTKPLKKCPVELICLKCNRIFVRTSDSTKHSKSCGKLFQCHLCEKSFLSLPGLKVHLTITHKVCIKIIEIKN